MPVLPIVVSEMTMKVCLIIKTHFIKIESTVKSIVLMFSFSCREQSMCGRRELYVFNSYDVCCNSS